jgi:2-polyprenyl-3-methyl-5-hydroxy-6-metoxy-1,4-benzoquinol methylase
MDILACPACSSTAQSILSSPTIGFTVTSGARVFMQPSYSVVECRNCGLLYKTSTLSSVEFDEYYHNVDYQKWETNREYPTEEKVIELLKALPRDSKILDFGCSSGRLLSRFVGYHQCCGYDVNTQSADEARQKGLRILSKEEISAAEAEKFDAVIVLDVFEHLLTPFEVVSMLEKMVKPKGFLIIVTGDGDNNICRFELGEFWYFRIIEHVAMITRRHAEWLAAQLAIRLIGWEHVSHYHSSRFQRIVPFVQHLAYWQFRRGRPFLNSMLRVIPGIRKAENWPIAPGYSITKDHVIAIFTK